MIQKNIFLLVVLSLYLRVCSIQKLNIDLLQLIKSSILLDLIDIITSTYCYCYNPLTNVLYVILLSNLKANNCDTKTILYFRERILNSNRNYRLLFFCCRLHGFLGIPCTHIRSIWPNKCRVFRPDVVCNVRTSISCIGILITGLSLNDVLITLLM